MERGFTEPHGREICSLCCRACCFLLRKTGQGFVALGGVLLVLGYFTRSIGASLLKLSSGSWWPANLSPPGDVEEGGNSSEMVATAAIDNKAAAGLETITIVGSANAPINANVGEAPNFLASEEGPIEVADDAGKEVNGVDVCGEGDKGCALGIAESLHQFDEEWSISADGNAEGKYCASEDLGTSRLSECADLLNISNASTSGTGVEKEAGTLQEQRPATANCRLNPGAVPYMPFCQSTTRRRSGAQQGKALYVTFSKFSKGPVREDDIRNYFEREHRPVGQIKLDCKHNLPLYAEVHFDSKETVDKFLGGDDSVKLEISGQRAIAKRCKYS